MITARRRGRQNRTVTPPTPDTPPVSAQVARLRMLLREFSSKAPITLPLVTMPESTDEAVGLVPDARAQARAEEYLRAAIGYRLRQDEQRRTAEREMRAAFNVDHRTVAVEVPDSSFTLLSATDVLSPVEAEIVEQMMRIASLPYRDQPTA
ncbi:hypothetical protein MKK55_15890 [Methylobacterium sp. J-059]|uniref:hypothetical protein n=1 Tax=Methylobacterium sp. J-059 TaxID=2836643 RepID=UPI001FBB8268|nr:hypothetical protein [Methylobacterium sp. J-059]MCJ2040413.1 hypothetical protein [Methylobacterium sp. J-059]